MKYASNETAYFAVVFRLSISGSDFVAYVMFPRYGPHNVHSRFVKAVTEEVLGVGTWTFYSHSSHSLLKSY